MSNKLIKIKNRDCVPCELVIDEELYYADTVFFSDRLAKVIYRHMDYEDQCRVIRFKW